VPTYAATARFRREFKHLSPEAKAAFMAAVDRFVAGLRSGHFDAALRIHMIDERRRIWSLSFAGGGRATFEYGERTAVGAHVVWRRIGDHSIYRAP
jgi:hypothetical protein